MISRQDLRRQARTIACTLPAEGWIPVDPSAGGRLAITHPDRPPITLEAKRDGGHHLPGRTFRAWIRTPNGWVDILSESLLAGRDPVQAALEDVRRTYGPEGQAAQALAEILGAAWAAGEASARLRVEMHRASVPEGGLVLKTGARACGLDDGVAETIARRVLRDLAGLR